MAWLQGIVADRVAMPLAKLREEEPHTTKVEVRQLLCDGEMEIFVVFFVVPKTSAPSPCRGGGCPEILLSETEGGLNPLLPPTWRGVGGSDCPPPISASISTMEKYVHAKLKKSVIRGKNS